MSTVTSNFFVACRQERDAVIQSVDRSIRMLLELQGARHLSLSELAARLDLSRSTTHGILRTLAGRDLVRQDAQTQRYHLGPAVLRLAGVYLDALDLRTRALARARDLTLKTGCATRIGVRSGDEVILVHHEQPDDTTARMTELGIGLPAHSSSLGKAILAFEPPDVLDTWPTELRPMTSTTITDLATLRHELDSVRSTFVAYEREESVIGEHSVASPIFGSGNAVLGAIGVVLANPSDQELDAAADPTRDIAHAISRELGADISKYTR